jgi:hypothetical protein
VVWDELNLLVELSLESVWPGSDDSWLESQHEWPHWAVAAHPRPLPSLRCVRS